MVHVPSKQEVGQLRKSKMPGLKAKYYVGTMQDDKAVKVVEKGAFNPLNCDAKIEVGGKDVGLVKGNWRAKEYSISLNGVQVASVKRKTSFSSLVFDADSYCLEMGPGCDMAFLVLVTIALDEMYHESDD
eukprot:TRINITY_DN24152_c0_g1_i1.p2 TRINITY_DN24152_c0_g1~~TRINITY_DN24152_c0_g1_i1.p2  ORF type:complete len:149 (-),score=67.29 TRINITY_DN24152_c0_g1_i1:88-477(-)